MKATEDQKKLIPQYTEKWKKIATTSVEDHIVKNTVREWYECAPHEPPRDIIILDNPPLVMETKRKLKNSLRSSLTNTLLDNLWDSLWASVLHSLNRGEAILIRDLIWTPMGALSIGPREHSINMGWFYGYAGLFDYAKNVLGIQLDKEKFTLFQKVCMHLPMSRPFTHVCLISKPPRVIHWDENRFLHNENGPAVEWKGYKRWSIHGILVNEQIVMAPQTQTLEQIEGDWDADRKTIRIERYGWPRYLHEVGAVEIDSRKNDIDNTKECLVALKDGTKRLVASCPTGRAFAMGVPDNVRTCIEAQQYLNPRRFKSLGRT